MVFVLHSHYLTYRYAEHAQYKHNVTKKCTSIIRKESQSLLIRGSVFVFSGLKINTCMQKISKNIGPHLIGSNLVFRFHVQLLFT